MNADPINHPPHYTGHPSGIECIEVAQYMGFCLGNAIKYIWRDGQKTGEDVNDDLRKAIWYIQREIDRRIDAVKREDECNTTDWSVRAEKPTDTIPTAKETPRFFDYADAQSQIELGNDYYHGRNGRTQNYETAVEWWKLAAGQGNAEAQWLLGNAYLFGRGVEKSKAEADRLWKLSQQNRNYSDSPQNPVPQTSTTPLVTKSASRPNLTGNTLAYAQAGDANRQYEMGKMCYYGDGMPEDKEQAVEWWKLAAAQGNYKAQLSLANAYRKKDLSLANYWLEQAGSQRTEEEAQ
jgi:TPR repeat protein